MSEYHSSAQRGKPYSSVDVPLIPDDRFHHCQYKWTLCLPLRSEQNYHDYTAFDTKILGISICRGSILGA